MFSRQTPLSPLTEVKQKNNGTKAKKKLAEKKLDSFDAMHVSMAVLCTAVCCVKLQASSSKVTSVTEVITQQVRDISSCMCSRFHSMVIPALQPGCCCMPYLWRQSLQHQIWTAAGSA